MINVTPRSSIIKKSTNRCLVVKGFLQLNEAPGGVGKNIAILLGPIEILEILLSTINVEVKIYIAHIRVCVIQVGNRRVILT